MMELPSISASRRVVRDILQGAWRRRYLILMPLLIMVPISLAAALLLPRTYVTTALVVISDAGAENPLARASGQLDAARLQERIGAIRALLVSDSLLQQVSAIFVPTGEEEVRKRVVRRLEESLDVGMVGWNMLRFELRSSSPKGSSAELATVIDRLFQTGRGAGLFKNAETVIVIDPPRDPEKPRQSPAIIAIAGILGGFLFGVTLAFLTELIDPRLLTLDRAEEVTGVPVLALIPSPSNVHPVQKRSRPRFSWRWYILIVLSLVSLALAYRSRDELRDGVQGVAGNIQHSLEAAYRRSVAEFNRLWP